MLSSSSAAANEYKVRIGQLSDAPTHVIALSCPYEGSCAGTLELALPTGEHAPMSISIKCTPGNAYFRFKMGQIDLAVNGGSSVYYMAIGLARKTNRVGLGLPLGDFALEKRMPGLSLPVLRTSPAFAEIQIDVRPEK
jgi:hypothetical protein